MAGCGVVGEVLGCGVVGEVLGCGVVGEVLVSVVLTPCGVVAE